MKWLIAKGQGGLPWREATASGPIFICCLFYWHPCSEIPLHLLSALKCAQEWALRTVTSKNECGIRNTAKYKQISILLSWATWNTALEPTTPHVYKNKWIKRYEIIFTTAELLTGVKFTVLKVFIAFVLPVVVHLASKYIYIDNFEVSSRIILWN